MEKQFLYIFKKWSVALFIQQQMSTGEPLDIIMLVLSGYTGSLYKDLFQDEGWVLHTTESRTEKGAATEGLWLNRLAVGRLEGQMELFTGGRNGDGEPREAENP